MAEHYERDRQGEIHWGWEDDFVKEFLEKRGEIARLLDVPIGTGRFMRHYGNVKHVVGIDVSEEMLHQAEKKREMFPGILLLRRGNITDIPYENRYFDLILCFRLFHLLPPMLIKAALCELSRVSNGRILVQFYLSNRVSKFYRLWELLKTLLPQKKNSGNMPWSHIQSYSHPEAFILKSIVSSGLRVLDRADLGFYQGQIVSIMTLGN